MKFVFTFWYKDDEKHYNHIMNYFKYFIEIACVGEIYYECQKTMYLLLINTDVVG